MPSLNQSCHLSESESESEPDLGPALAVQELYEALFSVLHILSSGSCDIIWLIQVTKMLCNISSQSYLRVMYHCFQPGCVWLNVDVSPTAWQEFDETVCRVSGDVSGPVYVAGLEDVSDCR